MSKIADAVDALARPIIESMGIELVEVEYIPKKSEASELVIYIDREEGVDIDVCEAVSRALDEPLDIADPVPGSYVLCVSSPGIDRPLKTARDFEKNLGKDVDVRFFAKVDGKKEITGTLEAYTENTVTVNGKEIARKDIALIRPHINF